MAPNTTPAVPTYSLGIDAGGTRTRWALAETNGETVASGHAGGMSALQMSSDAGREQLKKNLAALAEAVLAVGKPQFVCAGITGFDSNPADLAVMIANSLGIRSGGVTVRSDIEIACLGLYAPGEGYVVYAGTGSIAAFIDDAGTLHRAGGRGALLDDAGGGYWIACEALRHIWRAEDERPESWRDSPMACEIFKHIGGNEWAQSRRFVYGSASVDARGEIGKLALAVAAVADTDPVAQRILVAAGNELARLGRAMILRFGLRPMALTGRVVQLHQMIEQAMRAALPTGTDLTVRVSQAHVAAARIAAKAAARAASPAALVNHPQSRKENS